MTGLEKWALEHNTTKEEIRILTLADDCADWRKTFDVYDVENQHISPAIDLYLHELLAKGRSGLMSVPLETISRGINGNISPYNILTVIQTRTDNAYNGLPVTQDGREDALNSARFPCSKLPMLLEDIKNTDFSMIENRACDEFKTSSTRFGPVAPLTRNMDKIAEARDELRRTADLLQAVIDRKIYQIDVSKALSMSRSNLQNQIAVQLKPYIKSKLISLDELRKALKDVRSPGDKLLLEMFGIENETKNGAIMFLPDYNEDELWDIAFERLSKREYSILRMYTGAETGTPMSLDKIAAEFHLTRERIAQIKAKAIRKLRSPTVLNKIFPPINTCLIDCAHDIMAAADKTIEIYLAAKKEYERQARIRSAAKCYKAGIKPENAAEINCEIEAYRDRRAAIQRTVTLEEADLSTRLRNCLKRANIQTLNELLDMNCSQILRIRNLGRNTLAELHSAIKKYFGIDRIDLLEKP